MARIVVKKERIQLVVSMEEKAKLLANGRWRTEAARALRDAGKRTKTQVQRSVMKQAAYKDGSYGRNVVAGTRGVLREKELAFDIFGVPGGQRLEQYNGLRILKMKGAAAARLNAGKSASDQGEVKSGVWQSPRIFKRSFATPNGTFAMLPPGGGTRTGTAPRALWTFGHKDGQPRDGGGRFASRGIKYGGVRRLFGPSLRKEIVKDDSLQTFMTVGPRVLSEKIQQRMSKFLKL